jgi:CubicO group peptidase (beta-lactamase class C family)
VKASRPHHKLKAPMQHRIVFGLSLVCILTVTPSTLRAQTGMDHAIPTANALDAQIPKAMAAVGALGLAAAVIDGGKLVYVRSFGQRNQQGQSLQTDTVMSAASLTKPVFAYAVMQLADEGSIDLDTSIASYLKEPLPTYPTVRPYAAWRDLEGDERWKKLTPRILLSHRSGLANFQSLAHDGKLRIHFDPGTRYAYSGDGINLLQFVLERGLGLDVEAELQRRVFERFGMRHTNMTWQENAKDNQANGYTKSGQPQAHIQRRRVAAAGSMDTTIEDYARFAAGFIHGNGLSAKARTDMVKAQVPVTTRSQFPTMQPELPPSQRLTGLAAGLGVIVFDGPQGSGFYKGGHEDSVGNVWICVARQERCVVLLSNDVRAEKAFPSIVEFVLGDTGVPWKWEYGQ